MKIKLLIMLCVISIIGCAKAQDDRSFYQKIDTHDWPGDKLSDRQVNLAIHHFANPNACKMPWSWALIGPNFFLLKGTNYLVERRLDAQVPNIGWSKGYWGGAVYADPIPSVSEVKKLVEGFAADDCKLAKPVGGK